MACSQFSDVPMAKPIEVFALVKKHNEDATANKVNLSVGAYRSDEGKPWVLPSVRTAELQIANDTTLNHEYLPIAGLPAFREAAVRLMLGKDSPILVQNRAAGFQSLGGTGALRLGAEFLKRQHNCNTVYVAAPTWGNHHGIFKDSGFTDVRTYNCFDEKTLSADVKTMIETLKGAPEKAVVVLHGVAHNPTGCDPSHEQWSQIMETMREKKLFTFFDLAYQGMGTGDIEADAYAPRLFAHAGFEMFVAQSFSKNFGLYNERIGCFSYIVLHMAIDWIESYFTLMDDLVSDGNVIPKMNSQLEIIARTMYSNPANHGARIVATVLNNPALEQEWRANVRTMGDRMLLMRKQLYDHLKALGTPGDWTHIAKQIGMFSYTGLKTNQVAVLIEKYHIYLMNSGRINMCGLTTGNVEYVAKSIHQIVTDSS